MKSKKIVAIIGATSGIGYATAKYLHAQGYDVVLCGRKEPETNEFQYKYVDVIDEDSIQKLFLGFEAIHGLVYSVGVAIPQKSIESFDLEEYNKLMSVNVSGLLLCLKHSYPILKLCSAKVVIVNSLASRTFSQFSGVEYTMSKSALSGAVKQLAMEFAKDNVLINSVFPSMTATPMLLNNVDEQKLSVIESTIALKRIAMPKDVATAIEFLLSDNNTYITGSGIDVNGGQYLNG